MTGRSAYGAKCLLLALLVTRAGHGADAVVHRFLETATSPDGHWVAAIEGDTALSGRSPAVRELIVRDLLTGASHSITLPCGQVPQCWPASPA